MEEKPSLNMPVQRLKVEILPLDLPCSGPVTNSGEILTTGKSLFLRLKGHVVAQLRHCLTSSKIAGSIPDGAIGVIHLHNPLGRTIALGLTQHLTELNTRNISWGVKAAGVVGWQTYHLHVPIVLKSGNFSLLEPSGPGQALTEVILPFACDNYWYI